MLPSPPPGSDWASIRFWHDRQRGVVVSSFAGTLNLAALRQEQRLLADALRFDPSVRRIMDGRALTNVQLASRDLQLSGQSRSRVAPGPLVLLAESDAVFGVARMAASWFGRIRPNIRVYRNPGEAMCWLALPENYMEQLGVPDIEQVID